MHMLSVIYMNIIETNKAKSECYNKTMRYTNFR